MDPEQYFTWYTGRTRTCLVCEGEGCGMCGHMGVIPGEEWGADVTYKVGELTLHVFEKRILLTRGKRDEDDSVTNLSEALQRAGLGWLNDVLLDVLPKNDAWRFLEYMASKGELTSNDAGDIVADGLKLTQTFQEAGLPNLEQAIRKLVEEKAEIRRLEGTSADLAASLGAGSIEVQSPEQFAEPPPPEPKRPRKGR